MGIKVELEHTKQVKNRRQARKTARRIACDHLVGENIPDYYTRLNKMEREAKRYWKVLT